MDTTWLPNTSRRHKFCCQLQVSQEFRLCVSLKLKNTWTNAFFKNLIYLFLLSCHQLRPVTVVQQQITSSHDTADVDHFIRFFVPCWLYWNSVLISMWAFSIQMEVVKPHLKRSAFPSVCPILGPCSLCWCSVCAFTSLHWLSVGALMMALERKECTTYLTIYRASRIFMWSLSTLASALRLWWVQRYSFLFNLSQYVLREMNTHTVYAD